MKGAQIIDFNGRKLIFIPHKGRAFTFHMGGAKREYFQVSGLKGHPLASAGSVPLHRLVLFDHLGQPKESPCHWCGYVLPWQADRDAEFAPGTLVVNVDHVDYDTHNNEISNLVPACWWCNTGRGWGRFYPDHWKKWLAEWSVHHPKFRASVREIAEEDGCPNPYEKTPEKPQNNIEAINSFTHT